MKRKLASIVALIILPVLMVITSCGGDASVNLIFNQTQGNCVAANQSAATIQCDGGVLTFEGSAVTPNPCYYLKANLDSMNKSNIIIAIIADSILSQSNYCIECAGDVLFNGTVSPVGSCSRKVSIVYNGTSIAEYK